MTNDERIAALESQMVSLREEFTAYAIGREQILGDVEELFLELGKAMTIVAASLEDLSEDDEEPALYSGATGVLGRAFELQALLGIFRDNVADLHERLKSMRRPRTRRRRGSVAELAHGGV